MASILLTRGMTASVNAADFVQLSKHKWFAQKTREGKFYAARRDRKTGKFILMHRVVNRTPRHLWTDHIDGDRLNNRRRNLRSVTPLQSAMNKAMQRGQTMKGAWRDGSLRNRKKWRAAIRLNGKLKYLGRFATQTEAAAAYAKAEKFYFGNFSRRRK